MRNKDLEVKSLFFFHLGTFRRRFGVPPGFGPPFRPDQKVKLDKSEARREGLFLRHGFLGYDEGGHTSTVRRRVVTVAGRERASREDAPSRKAREGAHPHFILGLRFSTRAILTRWRCAPPAEGTKIMVGADRRGLPAAVSVENEVKLVVPVLKARRRFRLKRIEELMARSLTEVRLRLGPKRAQVSSRRGYSSGAGQFWRGALFYSTRRTSLSQRGQRGAVEEPIDNFRPRTGQGLLYA